MVVVGSFNKPESLIDKCEYTLRMSLSGRSRNSRYFGHLQSEARNLWQSVVVCEDKPTSHPW